MQRNVFAYIDDSGGKQKEINSDTRFSLDLRQCAQSAIKAQSGEMCVWH
jgi:hypothetical protein